MSTNITVKVDDNLAREAKILAARRGTSVSRMVAEVLEAIVRGDREYDTAMRRALSRLDKGYELGWRKPASRDELHEHLRSVHRLSHLPSHP